MIKILSFLSLIFLSVFTEGIQNYEIVRVIPHNESCFTEGLVWAKGHIIESCGDDAVSSVQMVDINSGKMVTVVSLPAGVFSEGVTTLNGIVYVLSWRTRELFAFQHVSHFRAVGSVGVFYSITGEGWGLTNDGEHLIMSDGSSILTYLHPPQKLNMTGQQQISNSNISVLTVAKTVKIIDAASRVPISYLNDLQYVDGIIYANIWLTDIVVMIDASSGTALTSIDLSELYPLAQRTATADVLNGIAHVSDIDAFVLTGKKWPHYFVLKFPAKEDLIHSGNHTGTIMLENTLLAAVVLTATVMLSFVASRLFVSSQVLRDYASTAPS